MISDIDPLTHKTMTLALFESEAEREAIECTALIWEGALRMMWEFQASGRQVWVIADFGSA